MSDISPIIMWFRRDLRLSDHGALRAACDSGRPVIPVWLLDQVVETHGACSRWRLGLGVSAFAQTLQQKGTQLVLRRGDALECLRDLVQETGATTVLWTRAYDPSSVVRDTQVKAALLTDGIEAHSFPGHVLFEPWTVKTGAGGYYKVFTPFWKAVRGRGPGAPLPAPQHIPAPQQWPQSDSLDDWRMGAKMNRGASVVASHVNVGASAADGRLRAFMDHGVEAYHEKRDVPSVAGTSRLSENLTYGEISVRSCWEAGHRAMEEGKPGAETFLKELAWRDFAYHLAYHTPHMLTANWRPAWDTFPWNEDAEQADVVAWKQGRTGIPFVDAAMREMYVTGHMHNRTRMIVASYLTKHLLSHWKIGQTWFADCLTDWDPASNAMGWQWAAGSGPDASPYFRVFNPETQRKKFDPDCAYVQRWIAEGQADPGQDALAFFRATPRSWNMSPNDPYPAPVVNLDTGRKRALAAYADRGF